MNHSAQSTRVVTMLVVAPWMLSACDERTPSVEDVARAHAAPGLELAGLWREEGQNRVLWILPEGDGFDVRAVTMPGVHQERVRGVLSGAVLELDPPLAGSVELHLCRFGTREVLLDPRGTRIGVQTGQPHGAVFERWKPDPGPAEVIDGYQKFVVDPLPGGLWELVDRDDGNDQWAWLEVSPTGVPAAFRVLVRQRTDGEPMPANTFVRASFESSALRCEAPILGEARWKLLVSGERACLVPETSSQTDAAEDPPGLHFRLVSRTRSPVGPASPWYYDRIDVPEEE